MITGSNRVTVPEWILKDQIMLIHFDTRSFFTLGYYALHVSLFLCVFWSAGTCNYTPTLKSALVLSEKSLISNKTYLFPLSEVL